VDLLRNYFTWLIFGDLNGAQISVMDYLSDDVIRLIYANLNIDHKYDLARTCKRLYKVYLSLSDMKSANKYVVSSHSNRTNYVIKYTITPKYYNEYKLYPIYHELNVSEPSGDCHYFFSEGINHENRLNNVRLYLNTKYLSNIITIYNNDYMSNSDIIMLFVDMNTRAMQMNSACKKFTDLTIDWLSMFNASVGSSFDYGILYINHNDDVLDGPDVGNLKKYGIDELHVRGVQILGKVAGIENIKKLTLINCKPDLIFDAVNVEHLIISQLIKYDPNDYIHHNLKHHKKLDSVEFHGSLRELSTLLGGLTLDTLTFSYVTNSILPYKHHNSAQKIKVKLLMLNDICRPKRELEWSTVINIIYGFIKYDRIKVFSGMSYQY